VPVTAQQFIEASIDVPEQGAVALGDCEGTGRWLFFAGRDLDKTKRAALTVTRPVADVIALAPDILAGKVRGRVVLEIDG